MCSLLANFTQACEHIAKVPLTALESTYASKGPWSFNFISFTVNLHLDGSTAWTT